MIKIKESKTADTRTCDFSKVTKKQLLLSSRQHIRDVRKGLRFFRKKLRKIAKSHDYTKINDITQFHLDFVTGFKRQIWYNMHKNEERHHLNDDRFIQLDINLFDVLEQIVDCVMAGMARSGKYRQEEISNDLLNKAYHNTIRLLLNEVKVKK